jgi:urease accessory protein
VKILIIEKIVTNIDAMDREEIAKRHMEKVYLESANLVKRIQRVTTDHGNEIGIRLKELRDLKAGDVLYMDDKNMIVVDVLSDDLLVISPRSLNEMGTIAHQLGNRHLPAQFEENNMLVQYDYLVEELLQELQIPFTREDRKVKQAFRHIGHSHES